MKKKIVSLALAVVLALSPLCMHKSGNRKHRGSSGYINCGRQQCCVRRKYLKGTDKAVVGNLSVAH